MRWSIVRVIWARELRDQLRDRRTVFMIAALPVLLYPVAGFGVLQMASGYLKQRHVVGVQGAEHLPPQTPLSAGLSPVPAAAWFAAAPDAAPGVPLAGLARLTGPPALAHAWQSCPAQDFPPLLLEDGGRLRFPAAYLKSADDADTLILRPLEGTVPPATGDNADLPALDRRALDARQVDVLLAVPPGFREQLARGGRPELYLLAREKDDNSRLAHNRVAGALARWKLRLKDVRLARRSLPRDFDDPFALRDPDGARPASKRATEDLFDVLTRIFPFILVMWALAGALYPAVDLCAGEKERGTMETLLISPASREEIVYGKFLTIWVFSAATALLNLLSMGLTTWQFSSVVPVEAFRLSALVWGVVLLLPLSAFFSAVCLAVGAYARSSKEGQYYLMPLFLVTMPLIFLTLAPGVQLNPFYSMVPVTGVALLLQSLMAAGTPGPKLWSYFLPVLAPMVLYSWLALRWAVEQFQREEVLFREAERLDLRLWLRALLRDKEVLPTAGEALCCFGLILALRWLSFSTGTRLSLLARTGIGQLAFVATPPLFMALLLTRRPRRGLGLHRPPWWGWPAAALLAVLVLPPLAELTLATLHQFPGIKAALEEYHPLAGELSGPGLAAEPGQFFLVLALLPAVCEELAFRGFILNGLARRFRPGAAALLSAFLFALYQMNVFQFVPYFLLGLVLALLTLRCGSALPAMLFHLVYNTLLFAPLLFPGALPGLTDETGLAGYPGLRLALATVCAVLAAGLLAAVVLLGRWRPLPVRPGAAPPHPAALPRAPSSRDLTRQAPS